MWKNNKNNMCFFIVWVRLNATPVRRLSVKITKWRIIKYFIRPHFTLLFLIVLK